MTQVHWDKVVADFVEKVERGEDLLPSEIEKFVLEGLQPLIEDHLSLRDASRDLAESNLEFFKPMFDNPSHMMKNGQMYRAVMSVVALTKEEQKVH